MEARTFKKFGGEIIEDLGQYLRDYLSKKPNERIYLGCDSVDYTSKIQYAVAVCMHNPEFGKGVHFVFCKDVVKKTKLKSGYAKEENWHIDNRLWGEFTRVQEVAEYLEKELGGFLPRYTKVELEKLGWKSHQNKLVDVCIDVNPEKFRKQKGVIKENKSNRQFDESVGFLSGQGYRVTTKPEAWAASCAADLVCKSTHKRKRKRRYGKRK